MTRIIVRDKHKIVVYCTIIYYQYNLICFHRQKQNRLLYLLRIYNHNLFDCHYNYTVGDTREMRNIITMNLVSTIYDPGLSYLLTSLE